jgi:hypothetical protein
MSLAFTTNPEGSAIVNTAGPIRQITQFDAHSARQLLAIVPNSKSKTYNFVQIQSE